MRVLLTTDPIGGVWDYACTLARALDDAGHDVLLVVLGEVDDRRHRLPEGVEVASRPYRLEWMDGSDRDVEASSAWVSDLARLWDADLVHLNQYAGALAGFDVPTLLVSHSDVLSWFSETLGAPAPDEWNLYVRRVRAALQRATMVVAPTQYQSQLLGRHYGRPADRVIHNGAVAPAHSASGAEPLAVCAARTWDSAKGIGILDEAAGRLGKTGVPIHLFGTTASPTGEHLETRHLVRHGPVPREEIDSWLTRATLYVAPSVYEPFGLAPLEAALHGCALVLSDIGAFRELWDACAEFFPPGDSVRLAEILSSLPYDREKVVRLAQASRRRALRRYTADRMTGEYLATYEYLVGIRASPTSARAVQQPA